MVETLNHREIMIYLKNMTTKLINLKTHVAKLEAMMMSGFTATGKAFRQVKVVSQAIVDETRKNTEHLDEFGGTIEADSFFDGTRKRVV
jgi:hypothetical protein